MSIFKDIWGWISGASKDIKAALGFGKDVVNWLKGLSDNGTLDLIVTVTPWKVDDALLPAFKVWLASFAKDINLIPSNIVDLNTALSAASANIKVMGDTARATTLTSIAAAAAQWHSEVVTQSNLTIQQAISSMPVVYQKPELLN